MVNPHVELKPSKQLTGLLSFMHLGAIICSIYALPWYFAMLATVIISLSWFYTCRRYAWLLTPNAVYKLWFDTEHCYLQTLEARIKTAELKGNSLLTPFLLVLNFTIVDEREHISIVVLRDMLDKKTFRQLKVFLKYRY